MATQEQAFDFTRASTKWVWNSTGTLVEVPVDQPAYDHDPVTGEPLGVLVEPEATNLLMWSEDAGNSRWQKLGATATAKDVKETASEGAHYIPYSAVNFGTGTFQDTVEVKAGLRRYIRYAGPVSSGARGAIERYEDVVFDLLTGQVISGDDLLLTVKELPDGWYRLTNKQVYLTDPNGASRGRWQIMMDRTTFGYMGDDTQVAVQVRNQQHEKGSSPTSYIPTDGAPVTRAADNLSRSLTGPDVNPQQGTFVFKAYVPERDANRYVAGRYAGSQAGRQPIYLYPSGGVNSWWITSNGGAGPEVVTPDTPPAPGTLVVIAVSYVIGQPLDDIYYTGEVLVSAYGKVTASTGKLGGLMNSINFVRGIGDSNGHLSLSLLASGTVPGMSYYPRAMTEQELIELTTINEE